jgi:tRNA G26 N,N-dimethylase Trm1
MDPMDWTNVTTQVEEKTESYVWQGSQVFYQQEQVLNRTVKGLLIENWGLSRCREKTLKAPPVEF